MNSQTFNFKETTEDSITYYIIPKGTFLYHGSNKIDSPKQLDKERHTFFALTNEYANKYAKETGNVLRFKVDTELKLVAMDKDNETLYKKASIEPINIKKIMDENYGFHNQHKRKSIPDKDNELSEYLCKEGYDGYAANHMEGTTFDEDLDPELIICDKSKLEFGELEKNKVHREPPRVERPQKKRNVIATPMKRGPGLFGDDESENESESESERGPGLFGDDESDDETEKGPGLFGFSTPTKGGKKKQNLSNVYKKNTMKRPVRAEDGTYTVKGKKYKELFGSREQVHNGTAYKTKAGLTKDDILMNKWGRLVSAKKHETAKKEMRLEKHGYSAKKGKFGYVKKNKTRKNKK